MGYWEWFNGVLEEAGVTATPENKARIDKVIHQHIDEHSKYGWRSAALEIRWQEDKDGRK